MATFLLDIYNLYLGIISKERRPHSVSEDTAFCLKYFVSKDKFISTDLSSFLKIGIVRALTATCVCVFRTKFTESFSRTCIFSSYSLAYAFFSFSYVFL